ncbi:MAG: PPC domain-containing DNA-binding protein [Acidobacteriaceae bacterium]
MKLKLYVLVLCLFLVNAGSMHAQESVQYLPPFRPLQKGQAPKMKVQLLSSNAGEKTYAVIFGKGDEVLAGLTEFAEEYHLGASRITGIGAISHATLGWLDLQKKMYRAISINGQSEVLSMIGDIALYNGKPVIHAHLAVAYPDGSVHGGHLIAAYVRPTLEVLVTEYPHAMQKKADPESGMALIDPDLADKQTTVKAK